MNASAIRRVLLAASRFLGGLAAPSAAPAPGTAARDDVQSDTFRALLEINKKINPAAPMDALLTVIAEEAARLLDVDNAGLPARRTATSSWSPALAERARSARTASGSGYTKA